MRTPREIETDLTDAVDRGQVARVLGLLEAGSDPNEENLHGESAVAVAAMGDNVELLELLSQYGGQINRANLHGWKPLHFAVSHSIDSTIQAGGVPGDEPTAAIAWLLARGADPNEKAANGRSAIDIAAGYKSQKVVDLLRSLSAPPRTPDADRPSTCNSQGLIGKSMSATIGLSLRLPEGWTAERVEGRGVVITADLAAGQLCQVTVDEEIRSFARGNVRVEDENHTVLLGERRWRSRLYAAAIADLRLSSR